MGTDMKTIKIKCVRIVFDEFIKQSHCSMPPFILRPIKRIDGIYRRQRYKKAE